MQYAAYSFTTTRSCALVFNLMRGREGSYSGFQEPFMHYVGYGVPRVHLPGTWVNSTHATKMLLVGCVARWGWGGDDKAIGFLACVTLSADRRTSKFDCGRGRPLLQIADSPDSMFVLSLAGPRHLSTAYGRQCSLGYADRCQGNRRNHHPRRNYRLPSTGGHADILYCPDSMPQSTQGSYFIPTEQYGGTQRRFPYPSVNAQGSSPP